MMLRTCGPLRRAFFYLGLLAGSALAGCQSPLQRLETLGAAHARVIEIQPTQPFPLALAAPPQRAPAPRLRVYLEGDGHAWATARQPSTDPSPRQLLVAELAFGDPTPSVYLARPCQFVDAAGCTPALWTDRRFSAEVLASLDQALDRLKARYRNTDFELIGYSGGGALALLLASRRDDVAQVQTLAGNLSPRLWAQRLQLSPLRGSLEPLDQRARLARLPQRHLLGDADRIVPAELFDDYRAALGDATCLEHVRLPGVSHQQGWAQAWAAWRERPLDCARHAPSAPPPRLAPGQGTAEPVTRRP
ncbi:hypothetical protein D9M68_165790 [compost metagenome]